MSKGKVKRPGLLRSSAIFASLTLVSRLMGFARDIVLSARLGAAANIAGDAYGTALWLPNLFRRIFAEGAFAAAFVPTYSRKLESDGEAAADSLASDALATLAAITVALAAVFMIAMPWLMLVLRPGYIDEPEKFRLSVILTQITMMYLPCMAIAALFAGILNAHGRFIVSAAYPTILNLVMLAVVLPFHDPIEAAFAASVGVMIAGVGQAALVWWGARKSGARLSLRPPSLKPEVKALIRLAAPAAFANSATQINMAVSQLLASYVAGMVVWMSVADRLYQLPMSMVGVAIGIALLPRLSQSLQAKDAADVQSAMDQALVFALAFSLPATAALMALPTFLIDALFTRGEFLASDASNTGLLLFHYAWGVPAFVLLRILQPAFFARQDTRTPMMFSLVSVGVNIVLGVSLFFWLGFYGVAIATSVASWINVAQLWVALARRGQYRPTAQAWSKMARVAAASAVLGLVLGVAAYFRPELQAALLNKEIAIVVVCAVGGALYPVLLFAFGGVTIAELKTVVRRSSKTPPAPPADLP